MTMLEIIKQYNETKDKELLKVIIEYFSPLMKKICSKYSIEYQEDLFNICVIYLPKAILKYNPNKGSKLTTYIYSYLNFYCKDYIKKQTREEVWEECQMDNYINKNASSLNLELKMDIEQLLKENLTPMEIKIVHLRYGFNGYSRHTFEEINKIMNIPSSFYQHEKILNKLRKTEYIKNFKY